MRFAIFLGLFLVPAPVAAQTGYDVGLGMFHEEVDRLVGTQIITRTAERSLTTDEKWEGRGFEVFFCAGRVAAIHIPLANGARSWISAVARENTERGPATLNLGMASLGVVDAQWLLRDGSKLSFSLHDLDNGTVLVNRWLSTNRVCESR